MLRYDSQASEELSVSRSPKAIYIDPGSSDRKFGKHIQKRQLEIPEYAAHFVDYKSLKKVRSSQSN